MSVLKGISKERERRTKVHDMSVEDAQQELTELRRELFDLRLQMTRGEVRDVRQFARTRKDIARLMYKLRMAQFEGDEEDVEFVETADEDEATETEEAEEATEAADEDEATETEEADKA